MGCRQHAEGAGDGAAARGSGTSGRSGDGGCGGEADEGREGEELHVADVDDKEDDFGYIELSGDYRVRKRVST